MDTTARVALRSAADGASQSLAELAKRINIPTTPTSPAGLVQANTIDPFSDSGKYGNGWTYLSIVLLGSIILVRIWHFWQDKIRQALYKQDVEDYYNNLYSAEPEWPQTAAVTGGQQSSQRHFFPEEEKAATAFRPKSNFSSIGPINDTLALFRWVFYRPIPDIRFRKHRFTFPALAILVVGFISVSFVTLYSFLLQPLYWQSIQYGSPPVAVRSGMIAVAMTPWIIATASKANLLSLITGIGPERLNVVHRWASYVCLFMSLVHTVPFFVQPVWKDGGMAVFGSMFPPGSGIIYGSGIAVLVPLGWLCVASLPILRRYAYEIFALLHAPVGYVYVGMLFWHTKNALMTWNYLYASCAIIFVCNIWRLFKLNWTKPWRKLAWMTGDEAAINIMTENCIKITIPTQMRWSPGQYVYLRMPGISILENHPFTISSLCSEDFPSEYGEEYRDCVLVFRPYGGFTRKVLEAAIEKGPFHTYRAFLDGPYGGMRRDLAAFDTVILIAGGSGITSLMSQLLNLIKRMRDGKAITKKIVVIWALKRLEAMDWFREELRICREAAPPESVTCKFFVTASVRQSIHQAQQQHLGPGTRAPRPLSNMFHDKLDGFVAGIASKRNSALIAEVAQGDPDKERELRAEQEDRFTALPQQKYLQPYGVPPPPPGPPPSLVKSTNTHGHTEDAVRRLESRGGVAEHVDAKDSHFTHTDEATMTTHDNTNNYNYNNNNNNGDDDLKKTRRPREFHFPPMQPKTDIPHFNYAPPISPTKKRHSQYLAPPTLDTSHPSDSGRTSQERPSFTAFEEEEPSAVSSSPPHPLHPAAGRSSISSNLSSSQHQQIYSSSNPTPQQQQQQRQQQQQHNRHSPPRGLLSPPDVPELAHLRTTDLPSSFPNHTQPPQQQQQQQRPTSTFGPPSGFEFGFAQTPTEFQKSLMRFAFPIPHQIDGGWSVEYGRPDLGYMLREWATGGSDGRGILGRRTAVFVCGPPAMRVGVANSVARLQAEIWGDDMLEEIFLHTENYNL